MSRRRERAEPLRRCGDASTCGSNGLLIGGNVLLLSTSGFKKTFSGACPTLAVMIAVKYYTIRSTKRQCRATRESARTPFVRSPTVTRGPRGQQGRRGLVGGAFGWRGSSLLGRWDPSAGASIPAPFSSSGRAGTRDPGLELSLTVSLRSNRRRRRDMTFQIFVGGQRVNSADVLNTPAWSHQVRLSPPVTSHAHACSKKRGGCFCRL